MTKDLYAIAYQGFLSVEILLFRDSYTVELESVAKMKIF